MPKADIVVPCYNYGRFLEACVRSVLEQSVTDLRVLIIDDASTDDSLSIASKLAEADPRVVVTSHTQNWGHIRTYNQGIEWASADYFLLLSADDLLLPGALERATGIMDRHPDIVLTHGNAIEWQDDLPFPQINVGQGHTWTWRRQDLIREMCACNHNLVYTATAIARTSVQKAIGGYRSFLPHSADWEMWLRFAAHGGVAVIDGVQGVYRRHSANMSDSYYDVRLRHYQQQKQAFDTFFDEYEGRVPESRKLRAQADRVLSEGVYWSGIANLCHGRFSAGFELLRFSMDLSPKLRYGSLIGRPLMKILALGKRAISILNRAPARLAGSIRWRRSLSSFTKR
jgi:glycosyltransferase involved in cell wall biosynthesis